MHVTFIRLYIYMYKYKFTNMQDVNTVILTIQPLSSSSVGRVWPLFCLWSAGRVGSQKMARWISQWLHEDTTAHTRPMPRAIGVRQLRWSTLKIHWCPFSANSYRFICTDRRRWLLVNWNTRQLPDHRRCLSPVANDRRRKARVRSAVRFPSVNPHIPRDGISLNF